MLAKELKIFVFDNILHKPPKGVCTAFIWTTLWYNRSRNGPELLNLNLCMHVLSIWKPVGVHRLLHQWAGIARLSLKTNQQSTVCVCWNWQGFWTHSDRIISQIIWTSVCRGSVTLTHWIARGVTILHVLTVALKVRVVNIVSSPLKLPQADWLSAHSPCWGFLKVFWEIKSPWSFRSRSDGCHYMQFNRSVCLFCKIPSYVVVLV